MSEEQGKIYDSFYYKMGCGRPYKRDEEWLQSYDKIASRIIQEIHPRTVLDAGCALGLLVEGLRNHGAEAYGVDISEFAIKNVHPSIQSYCWQGSITDPFPQKYDLIVTIEVLEHMPKEAAENAVANLCAHADDVLFSSGDQDYREVTHFNLQPPEYWAALFAQHGFFRDVDFDGSFITPWTVRFRRMDEPVHRIIMGYERRIDRLIQENAALRQVNLEQRNQAAVYDDQLAQKGNEVLALNAQLSAVNPQLIAMNDQLNAMTNQLNAITGSRMYQVMRSLRGLIPPGSRREKLGLKIWRILRP